MAERYRITRGQAHRIRELERELGDRTLRTLLTGGNERLMRPERLENLKSGRAMLKPWERERIALVRENRAGLKALVEKKEIKESQQYKVNRAARTWLVMGKESDIAYDMQPRKQQRKQQRVVRALKFLGYDNLKDAPYIRKAG